MLKYFPNSKERKRPSSRATNVYLRYIYIYIRGFSKYLPGRLLSSTYALPFRLNISILILLIPREDKMGQTSGAMEG